MKRSHGFTVAELVIVIAFVLLTSILLIFQKGNVAASQRDEARKVAINAMYYNLEEVFYKENKYYPESISSDVLKAMDPELFTDPLGNQLGEPDSSYRYDAVDCQNGRCQGYTLRSQLEKEADYIKTSRN